MSTLSEDMQGNVTMEFHTGSNKHIIELSPDGLMNVAIQHNKGLSTRIGTFLPSPAVARKIAEAFERQAVLMDREIGNV